MKNYMSITTAFLNREHSLWTVLCFPTSRFYSFPYKIHYFECFILAYLLFTYASCHRIYLILLVFYNWHVKYISLTFVMRSLRSINKSIMWLSITSTYGQDRDKCSMTEIELYIKFETLPGFIWKSRLTMLYESIFITASH